MCHYRWLSALLGVCMITTLGGSTASAQGTTSRVVGTVTDTSGGLILGRLSY